MAAGAGARNLDRVFVGIRPTQGKEHLAEFTAGSHIRHGLAGNGADFRGHTRRSVGNFIQLRFHRIDHTLVAMANIDTHGHRIEIEITFVVDIPEIHTLGAFDRDGIDPGLSRPRPKNVLF